MAFSLGDIIITLKAKTDDLKAGMAAVQEFGDKVQAKLGTVGKAFANSAEAAGKIGSTIVTAAGIGAAAIAGLTLKGGFTRALDIQDAQAQLKGLGYSMGDIKTITDNTLAAVKGTAYSLNDAMTIATTAMAAGVKQGKDLTAYLQNVADAATIANVPLSEMGPIFNQIQANGKLSTIQLQELQDRGLPVMAWLASSYHVSAAAMSDMVSSGKVDAARFEQVMHDHVGGAALSSADTVRGAWANMQAAMARVGAKLVTQYLPTIQAALASATKWFDDHSAGIVDAVGSIVKTLGGFFDYIKSNAPVAAAVLGAAGAVIAAGLWAIVAPLAAIMIEASPFILIAAAIAAGLAFLASKMGGWGNLWSAFTAGITQAGQVLWQLFGPALTSLWQTIQNNLWPALQNLWQLIVQLTPLWKFIAEVIGVEVVVSINLLIDAINVVVTVFSFLLNAAIGVVEFIKTGFTDVMAVFNLFGDVAKVVIDLVIGYFDLWIGAVTYVFDVFRGLVTVAWNFMADSLKGPINAVTSFFQGAWNFITGLWGGAANWFNGIWGSITKGASGVGSGVASAIGGAFGVVQSVVKSSVNWIISRIDDILTALNNTAGKLPGVPKLGLIPQFAQGVQNFMGGNMFGGLALVGENGPEMVGLPRGSNVYSANTTRQMMAGAGGGGVTINIPMAGAQITSPQVAGQYAEVIGDQIIQRLKQQVRIPL